MKLSGLRDRPQVTEIAGRVLSADTVSAKTMTVRQTIVAEFEAAGAIRQVSGSVTEPSTQVRAPGDPIPVFVLQDGSASLTNPEDPWLEGFLAAIAIGVPALALFFSARYLRYRAKLRRNAAATLPDGQTMQVLHQGLAGPTDLVVRGRAKIKSRDERLREEAEHIRQMHDRAKRRT